jgi:hypothetical protein
MKTLKIIIALMISSGISYTNTESIAGDHDAWTLDSARTAVGQYRDGHPFTGPFYIWWQTDIKALVYYENGKPHGPVMAWHHDGSKMFEGQMKDGQKSGVWRHWDMGGNLLAEGEYKNGKSWTGKFIEGFAPPLMYIDGVPQYPKMGEGEKKDRLHSGP